MIQVTFVGLLDLYNTSPLLALIFHTVLILCPNLCIMLPLCIYKWPIIYYDMSKELLMLDSTLLQIPYLIFFLLQMQIGKVVLSLEALPSTIVSILVEILSYGVLRNNQQFLAPAQKLNIGPWQTLPLNSHGLPFSCKTFAFHYHPFHCYTVII